MEKIKSSSWYNESEMSTKNSQRQKNKKTGRRFV